MKPTKKNVFNKDRVKNHELIHHSVAARMEPRNKRTETRSKRDNKQIRKPRKV